MRWYRPFSRGGVRFTQQWKKDKEQYTVFEGMPLSQVLLYPDTLFLILFFLLLSPGQKKRLIHRCKNLHTNKNSVIFVTLLTKLQSSVFSYYFESNILDRSKNEKWNRVTDEMIFLMKTIESDWLWAAERAANLSFSQYSKCENFNEDFRLEIPKTNLRSKVDINKKSVL